MENATKKAKKKPVMAICYDFDKTLSPDDMQTFTLIPSLGMEKEVFWEESNALARENRMDHNLAWMYQLYIRSRASRQNISREYFQKIGADVPLYKGVETWFDRVNQYGASKGLEIEHYIISSGLKELIEGSRIAHHFKRIYASSYLYDPAGVAEWPAQAVNYTNKTQYIFRIAKGVFEEYDGRVNDSMPDGALHIPYENIVYIGDSATDIPCMRLVKSKGGYSIGVYDPEKNFRKNVYQLFNDQRINFYAPADYSAKSRLSRYIRQIVDEIAARETIKREKELLERPADLYRVYTMINQLMEQERTMPAAERKKMQKTLAELKELIEGNVD